MNYYAVVSFTPHLLWSWGDDRPHFTLRLGFVLRSGHSVFPLIRFNAIPKWHTIKRCFRAFNDLVHKIKATPFIQHHVIQSVFVHENVQFKIVIPTKRLRVSLLDLNGLRSSLHPFVGLKCGQKLRQWQPLLSEPWLWSEFTTSLLNFMLKRMTWIMCLRVKWNERSWAFLTEEKMERGNWNWKDVVVERARCHDA